MAQYNANSNVGRRFGSNPAFPAKMPTGKTRGYVGRKASTNRKSK